MANCKDTNKITLQGSVVQNSLSVDEEFETGEKIYSFLLSVPRSSGTDDVLVLRTSNRLYAFDLIDSDALLEIEGELRSKVITKGLKKRVLISVFCKSISEIEKIDTKRNNICELSGVVGKTPEIRSAKTSDRILCEIQLKVKRLRNKISFIPVIVWGRDAKFASSLSKDTYISVIGRFQSRQIIRHSLGSYEDDVVYELSVEKLKV